MNIYAESKYMNKIHRLKLIEKIIAEQKIGSQKELCDILAKNSVDVTQATLSRDLNILKVIRIVDEEKGHIYALPFSFNSQNENLIHHKFPVNNFLSIKFSNNIAVIKCTISFASTIALIIDEMNFKEVIGTIGGDDTVMVILAEGVSGDDFTSSLLRRIPDLNSRI